MRRMNNSQNNGENPFVSACQMLNHIAVSTLNWLQVASTDKLHTVRHEQGCLRSLRFARTNRVSDIVTPKSALQVVLLPANFDHARPLGTDHPQWHLLVYSWLDKATTERLVFHLKEKADGNIHCRIFRVEAAACQPIATF